MNKRKKSPGAKAASDLWHMLAPVVGVRPSYAELATMRRDEIMQRPIGSKKPSTAKQKLHKWEIERDLGILTYAEERRLDLSPANWRENAIFEAAMEHPIITPRVRGRPKAEREGPDIALRGLTAKETLQKVDLIKEKFLRRFGRPETDREVAKALVEIHYSHSKRRWPDDEEKVARQVERLAQRITAARDETGKLQKNHRPSGN